MMTFADALNSLENGFSVFRSSWERADVLVLEQVVVYGGLTTPVILIIGEDNNVATWSPSNEDLFARDWQTTRMQIAEPYGGKH